ncbi:hypothetical protein [Psychrobacter sp. AT9]|uniref:hypothetical protein n=1 Tax=Psychrobacter sp. AT9 TaxID=3242893 RepID=UPI0039A6DC80
MFKNLTLADALKKALMLIAQAVERCHQLLFTVNKDNTMWSSNILDYPAHWLFIAHNSRNNRRTKAKRKK